ncbi:MAG: transcription termination factor Rho [Candidatus Cloacimonadota bacterium]|nr:transcription termination factor Rho [Candidatus Cloacimonadota bacterium]
MPRKFHNPYLLKNLLNKKVLELHEIARELGVKNYSIISKKQLTWDILDTQAANQGLVFTTGIIDITKDGFGFLRSAKRNYTSGYSDIYVSKAQVKKFRIKQGHMISGPVRSPKEEEKYFALIRIDAINGEPPINAVRQPPFEKLTPLYPDKKFNLESDPNDFSTRIIDMFTPIGKGQRGLIVSAPRTGKTVLMQKIVNAILRNHNDTHVIVLLVDERPEEVTEMKRIIEPNNSEVVSSTFDETAHHHVRLAEMVIEKAKRMVEFGKDVVILLDSITRLARAYNTLMPASGRVLSGGVDANALHNPKRFFGAARNTEEGGSLTIIATALIHTGSKMDTVIFEEFKGTGNMELVLDRSISDLRQYPAIDLITSGTRREELLLSEDFLNRVFILRKILKSQSPYDAIQMLKDKMAKTTSNREFLSLMSQ